MPTKLDLYSNFVTDSLKSTQSMSVTTATTTLASSTTLTSSPAHAVPQYISSPVHTVPQPCATLPPTPSANLSVADMCSNNMDMVIEEVAKGNFERGYEYDYYIRRKSRVSSTSSSQLSIESPSVSIVPSTPIISNITTPSSVPIPTTTSPCITLKPSISIGSHSNMTEQKGFYFLDIYFFK